MALEHAILVALAERSASGYDLARRFDASIGHFWSASHQQIYKVLGRMEEDKRVESHLVAQDGRPDKKVYSITETGHTELTSWLATPTRSEALRSEFALRLRALHLADRDTFITDVRARRAKHAATLATYEASEARFYPNPTKLTDTEVGPWLALRGGIRIERGGIEWCDEILQALGGSAEGAGA
jgi:DNA-binding PadR family transcriptional regulator